MEALQSLYRLDDTLTTIENVNVRGNINESLISGFGPPIFVDPRHPFADPRQPLGEPVSVLNFCSELGPPNLEARAPNFRLS